MSIEKEFIKVDYTGEHIPDSVKNFRPDVYRDGDVFYCELGAPPNEHIMSKGASIEEAMIQWDIAYQQKARK